MLVAALLIGAEVFAGMVLLGLVLLVILLVAQRGLLRERRLYAATAVAVSLVVFEVLVAVLQAQIAGPARVHADIAEEVRGSSDLALATPTRLSAIAPEAAIRLGDQFLGTKETYLGIPLLLVVALVVARRRSPLVRVGFAMLLVCMVLSLGSRLRVGGLVTPVPVALGGGRVVAGAVAHGPSRLALFTALFAGLLLAVALESLWSSGRWRQVLAVATAVLVLAFLVPPAPAVRAGGGHAAVLHHLGGVRAPAGRGRPRGPVPQKGRANQAMVWQAQAGMWFKMPGGYFVGPGPNGGTLREAPPTTTSGPRPDPAGRAPPT